MEKFYKIMRLNKKCQKGNKPAQRQLEKLVPRCTMCGKLFDEYDYQENNCFTKHVGYGSKYDLHKLTLNLCTTCFDKILNFVVPQCKENPLQEEE